MYQVVMLTHKNIIRNWRGVKYDRNIGELDIYTIDKSNVLPSFYTVNKIECLDTSEEGLKYVLGMDLGKSVYLSGLSCVDYKLSASNLPDFTYKEVNPEKYTLSVKNSTGSYILVFNEIYGENWILRINDRVENGHFVANGLVNAWKIDQKGDYTIDVVFKVWPWD